MKKFITKYKMLILSIIILMIWGIIEIINCYNEGLVSNDPIILYYHLFKDLSLSFLPVLAPLFVMVPAIYTFYSEPDDIKKKYIKALKIALILPLFAIFIILLCCLLTGGFAFGSGKELYGWIASPDIKVLSILPVYMIVYTINLFLHGVLYINLGFIYVKKNSNILVTTILSYLSVVILDIFIETFIGGIVLSGILNIHNISPSLNLFNIWTYDGIVVLPFMIIYSLILVTISFIAVWYKIKKKEDAVLNIDNGKISKQEINK